MGLCYWTTCEKCKVDAPDVGSFGRLGLPCLGREERRGYAQNFGFIYDGLAALELLPEDIEAMRWFLEDHDGHPLIQGADDHLQYEGREGPPVGPSPEARRPRDSRFVDAFFELACSDCAARLRFKLRRMRAFEPRLISAADAKTFEDHVATLDISNSYRAGELFDHVDKIASFLRAHRDHAVSVGLDEGPKSRALAFTAPRTATGETAAHERALGDVHAPEAVEALYALRHRDPSVRQTALATLAAAREPGSLAYVVSLFADPEATVRVAAVRALGAIADPRRIPALGQALGDETAAVRDEATAVLNDLGVTAEAAQAEAAAPRGPCDDLAGVLWRESVDPDEPPPVRRSPDELRALLQHPDEWVRSSAVDRLACPGTVQETWAQDHLVRALADPSTEVRRSAVEMIRRRKLSRATDRLLGALDDYGPGVAVAAADALGVLQAQAAVGPLCALLRRPDTQNGASTISGALVAIGGPAMAAQLAEAFLDNTSAPARRALLLHLTQLADPAVLPALVTALSDPADDIRTQAAWALKGRGHALAARALRLNLDHANEAVRTASLEALLGIKGRDTHRGLVRALRDRAELIRYRAAHALAKLKDSRSRRALVAAARTGDPMIGLGAWRRLVAWGQADTEPALVAGFEHYWPAVYADVRKMAGCFLECENPRLADAARRWMSQWDIKPPRGTPRIHWSQDADTP